MAASGQVLLGVESEFRASLAAIRDASALLAPHQGNGQPHSSPDGAALIRHVVGLLERRLSDLSSLAIQGERRRTVDLDVEVREAVKRIAERARRHGVQVTVKSPPRNKLARAEIRPENVRRILLLLFHNSVLSFAREQGRHVEIKVWGERTRPGSTSRTMGRASPRIGPRRCSSPTARRERGPGAWG